MVQGQAMPKENLFLINKTQTLFFQSCNDELSWSGEINESVNKLEKM